LDRWTLGAIDRARMRAYLNPQLREFLDTKDVSSSAQMVARVEEWKANTFDRVNVFGTPGGRKGNSLEVGKNVRKAGERFLCGKPGHFAKECRSAGKPAIGNVSNTPMANKPDQSNKTFKCYGCGEMGHKRPECPNKTKRNKKVKVTNFRDLGHNDTMAKAGGICIPITLDTGADITLLPAELQCVREYTGSTALVKGVWIEPRSAPVAQVELMIGNTEDRGTAAMVPGAQLGWEGTLAFSLDNPEQVDLLHRLNQDRINNYSKRNRRYIPVSVSSEGEIEGAVMIADLPQGDKRLERVQKQKPSGQVITPDLEMKHANRSNENTPNDIQYNAEESGVEVVGEKVGKVEIFGESRGRRWSGGLRRRQDY